MELRDLPSTDALAEQLADSFTFPRPLIVEVCRREIAKARAALLEGHDADPDSMAREVLTDLQAARPTTVINATGVLLHTNLGRSVVPSTAADTARRFAMAASNVEIDPRNGRRSGRHDYLGPLLASVSGSEAALAVNNNAGALMLALASMASPGRVAVSRGELIEIGGSFRLPDLMAASGVELVEVGTTNRTRIRDYATVASSVDVLLKVHPSNYRIAGFQEEASAAEIADLAHSVGIPFIHDVGSGLVDAEAPWLGTGDHGWLGSEPGVRQSVAEGADLVLYSGDKLFGGPQAGIIAGSATAVGRCAKHPIARAVRLDGTAIAALAATAELYLENRVLEIPFWSMASTTLAEIEDRSDKVIAGLAGTRVIEGASIPGAGSVPGETIPTMLIEVDGDEELVWSALAAAPERVLAARREGRVYLDMRSVLPSDDGKVRSALERALS